MSSDAISQRDYMRKLSRDLGGSQIRVCASYAEAERNGFVKRNRNTHDLDPEIYAEALWADGIKKGWLSAEDRKPSGEMGSLSVAELLLLHAQIGEALRDRGVVRSANNPTGDLAEYLFCRAFGWKQAPNSERGFDAIGPDGVRYQIKGRRIHRRNKSRQLSAIRDIEKGHFQVLAAVLFDDDFRVTKAALVPVDLVVERSSYIPRTNSNRFMLRDEVWNSPGVRDVTAVVASAMP